MVDSPPRPAWQDLPAELLADIARRLPCLVDRVHMSKACRSFRRAAAHGPPRQLPWLLLPYRATRRLPPDGVRTAAFFCVLCSETRHLRVGNDTGGARFFGSYDGGWLFLAHGQTRHHALVNLHTDRRIPLPDSVSWEGEPSPLPMVIHGATLSSPPPAPVPAEQRIAATLSSPPVHTDECIAAAIVHTRFAFDTSRKIAFWRVELDHVAFVWEWDRSLIIHCEDVIHYKGAFHFLTRQGNVMVCEPEFQEGGLVVRPELRLVEPEPAGWEPPHDHEDDLLIRARYLVESRGELLMVTRCARRPRLPASAFRVFQMTQQQLPDGVVQRTWTELHTMDGRMLFVALGSSRSYEAADFPGFQDGVYFLDDSRSNYYLVAMRQYRKYACDDNGNWSEPPPRRWFPRRDPSNYSSPVWFLP